MSGFFWDEETGVATTIIEYEGQVFEGKARCHPDDMSHKNEEIGKTISEARAMIKYLTFIKNFEIKNQLNGLRQLYFSINKSSQYNEKSYESKMLNRQIRILEEDYKAIKEEIAVMRKCIAVYSSTIDVMIKKLNIRLGKTE